MAEGARRRRRSKTPRARGTARRGAETETGTGPGTGHSSSLSIGRTHGTVHRTNDAFNVEFGFFDMLYKPRTLITLALLLGCVGYVSFSGPPTSDVAEGLTRGIYLAITVFLVYGCLQFRDSEMVRPHPIVWRLVHAAAIVYVCFLVTLLPLDLPTTRGVIQHFHPGLGTSPPGHVFANDCRLLPGKNETLKDIPIVKMVFLDRFFYIHFLGYIVKALIVRDWGILLLLSFGFEVFEISTQFILPNLNECWWDRLLLDFAGCNLLGSIIGMYLVKRMTMYRYDWVGNAIPRLSSQRIKKAQRILRQFTPHSYQPFQWGMLDSPRRFAAVSVMVLFFLISEINFFFLKHHLWIDTENPVYLLFLAIRSLLAAHAIREWYAYNTSRVKTLRLGQNCWLNCALVCFEMLLTLKWNREATPGLYPPLYIIVCWGGFASTTILWVILRFCIGGSSHRPASTGDRFLWLLRLAFVPLLYIVIDDFWRTGSRFPPNNPPKGIILSDH